MKVLPDTFIFWACYSKNIMSVFKYLASRSGIVYLTGISCSFREWTDFPESVVTSSIYILNYIFTVKRISMQTIVNLIQKNGFILRSIRFFNLVSLFEYLFSNFHYPMK